MRMGRLWTSMIIAEVALTVGILPTAVFFGAEAVRAMTTAPGFAAEQYLTGMLSLDREVRDTAPTPEQNRAYALRFARQRDEVLRRLGDERGVQAVTFAADIPGIESSDRIELDSSSVPFVSTVGTETRANRTSTNVVRVRRGVVDPTFFDVFEVPVLAGRTFGPTDADSTSTAAIVNRAFVETVLQGRNAIGQRFRMLRVGQDWEEVRGPWQQIVGVVDNFPAHIDYERPKGVWYTAAGSAFEQPSILAVRMRGADPAEFGARLRAIAASVEPGFQIRDVQPMDDVIRASQLPLKLAALLLIAIGLSVLVLASAGLYSLMSVIVTQRRREIGIRIALGADRRRVLSSIFSRAARQVGAGVAIGLLVALLLNRIMTGEMQSLNAWLIMPGVAMLMLAVGVIAAIGPARRGLRIQPITVLKEDRPERCLRVTGNGSMLSRSTRQTVRHERREPSRLVDPGRMSGAGHHRQRRVWKLRHCVPPHSRLRVDEVGVAENDRDRAREPRQCGKECVPHAVTLRLRHAAADRFAHAWIVERLSATQLTPLLGAREHARRETDPPQIGALPVGESR